MIIVRLEIFTRSSDQLFSVSRIMHSEYSLYTCVFVCDSINANKVPTAFYRVYSWRTSKLVYRQHRVLVGNVVKKHSCIFKSCSIYRSPLFFVLSSSQSSGWVVASKTMRPPPENVTKGPGACSRFRFQH